MNNPKISVIIPTYRTQGYFEKCIESLSLQTLNNCYFEVLIIHNGPIDCELYIKSILEMYQLNHRYFYVELPNVSNARNIGISNCVGQYVLFLDDDDYLDNDYLKRMYEIVVLNKYDLIVSNLLCFNPLTDSMYKDYIGEEFDKLIEHSEIDLFTARKFLSSSCAKLIRKNCITNVFDLTLKQSEDAFFMCSNSIDFNSIFLCHSMFYYRNIRLDSVSRNKKGVIKRDFAKVVTISRFCTLLFKSGYSKKLVVNRILAVIKSITFDLLSLVH